jgi:hypothetical protein
MKFFDKVKFMFANVETLYFIQIVLVIGTIYYALDEIAIRDAQIEQLVNYIYENIDEPDVSQEVRSILEK